MAAVRFEPHKIVSQNYVWYLILGGKKNNGSGGIRTHAIEMTGALNQRLRPLGHATTCTSGPLNHFFIVAAIMASVLVNIRLYLSQVFPRPALCAKCRRLLTTSDDRDNELDYFKGPIPRGRRLKTTISC